MQGRTVSMAWISRVIAVAVTSPFLTGCHEIGTYGVVDLTANGSKTFESVNLSNAEPWGSWSNGTPLGILLNDPLPGRFRLIVTIAHVYGDNVNKTIEVAIGSSVERFTASASGKAVVLTFRDVTPGSRLITFKIPNPQSPKSTGKSGDTRELGIGIEKIEIAPLIRS